MKETTTGSSGLGAHRAQVFPARLRERWIRMRERLREEGDRQRGIVGRAGCQTTGLYKDKSFFPWKKKGKKCCLEAVILGDAWKSVECCADATFEQ